MKIIEANVELMRDFDGAEVMKFIELCGRVCYKSEDNITDDSAEKFVRNIIKRGHESVLEHFSVTFKIICDRGISHEIVRHRIASYSQESTRFCNYSTSKFGNELTFIKPCFWNIEFECSDEDELQDSKNTQIWYDTMATAEKRYEYLIRNGMSPQEARSILPNSLKTEIVMTANLREWRHFLKLRTDKVAHPQMRQIALMLLHILKEKLPVIFEDIGE